MSPETVTGGVQLVDIFQGNAAAYLHYCDQPDFHWTDCEKPMWEAAFREMKLRGAYILDLGSGSGKLVDLLVKAKASMKNLIALEPNALLLAQLHKSHPQIGCILDEIENLNIPFLQQQEINLVTANMVINHLPIPAYCKMVKDIWGMLKPGGVFIYTVPEPARKARLYNFRYSDEHYVLTEPAPWGGTTTYYHRPQEYQSAFLKAVGFDVYYATGGYNQSHQPPDGPIRLMMLAEKP